MQGKTSFKELRRRRRQPKPPMFLLDLQLPFEEVVADLAYPRTEPTAGVGRGETTGRPNRLSPVPGQEADQGS